MAPDKAGKRKQYGEARIRPSLTRGRKTARNTRGKSSRNYTDQDVDDILAAAKKRMGQSNTRGRTRTRGLQEEDTKQESSADDRSQTSSKTNAMPKSKSKPTPASTSTGPAITQSSKVTAARCNAENNSDIHPILKRAGRAGSASTMRYEAGRMRDNPNQKAYIQVKMGTSKENPGPTIMLLRDLHSTGQGQSSTTMEKIEFLPELDPSEWVGLKEGALGTDDTVKVYLMAANTKGVALQYWRRWLAWVCLKHDPEDEQNVQNSSAVKKAKRPRRGDKSVKDEDDAEEDDTDEPGNALRPQLKEQEKRFREKHPSAANDLELWHDFDEHSETFALSQYTCTRLGRAWEVAYTGTGLEGPPMAVLRKAAAQAIRQKIKVSATLAFLHWTAQAQWGESEIKMTYYKSHTVLAERLRSRRTQEAPVRPRPYLDASVEDIQALGRLISQGPPS